MSTDNCTASGLRRIEAPFVVATPTGVRTRTLLRPTAAEEAALERIGVFLGGLYRQALASRIHLGRVDAKDQSIWRTAEKRRLTRAVVLAVGRGPDPHGARLLPPGTARPERRSAVVAGGDRDDRGADARTRGSKDPPRCTR